METRKKRILVIEDDREMRSLLQDFLEEEGCAVGCVEDGSEAFRKLAREKFDLIITDIRMPGLSGLDILPGLKQIQPGISIILITAFGSEDIEQRVLERGGDAYLEKPLHLEELKMLVNRLLSPRGGKEIPSPGPTRGEAQSKERSEAMGFFSGKKKAFKEIDGPVWGHLVNVHKIDVDTLANLMGCVEREGTMEGNKPVTFLRVFNLNHARQKGIDIAGWETLDQNPDLILFEGYLTRTNEVQLERKNA
jgi:CheY-like chemotaxis protein